MWGVTSSHRNRATRWKDRRHGHTSDAGVVTTVLFDCFRTANSIRVWPKRGRERGTARIRRRPMT